MQLYPAIDIRDGKCVRLTKGNFNDMTVYGDDPAVMAAFWQEKGGSFLHVVDLDGAREGRSANEAVIRRIAQTVRIPVQVGGGIRSEEAVRRTLALGIARCIIGTRAAREPLFMKALVETFGPEAVVAGIDAKDGMVAIEGWERVSRVPALELCLKMKEYGVRHIVYTDILRDGTLAGPNVAATRLLTEETGLDVIASGGVSCMEDLERLAVSGIQGAIIGKALYEKKIDLAGAVARFERS